MTNQAAIDPLEVLGRTRVLPIVDVAVEAAVPSPPAAVAAGEWDTLTGLMADTPAPRP